MAEGKILIAVNPSWTETDVFYYYDSAWHSFIPDHSTTWRFWIRWLCCSFRPGICIVTRFSRESWQIGIVEGKPNLDLSPCAATHWGVTVDTVGTCSVASAVTVFRRCTSLIPKPGQIFPIAPFLPIRYLIGRLRRTETVLTPLCSQCPSCNTCSVNIALIFI